MSTTIFTTRSSVGSQVREMRAKLKLTLWELACEAGVLEEDIKLLEQDLPVTLDCKTRILKTLWERTTIRKQSLISSQV